MKKLLFLSIALFIFLHGVAQDSSGTEQEVWPEVNLYYKFNKKMRLYTNVSGTKLKNSSYTDGGFGIYLDYFAFPILRKHLAEHLRDSTRGYYLWLRVGYVYSTSPPQEDDPIKENTLVTEFDVRFHFWKILTTSKNRFDWRNVNGDWKSRYRARITFEKDMKTAYIYFTPSIYGEYYVYFQGTGLNRFRISPAIQIKITKHIEFETYYVYQFDNGKKVDALEAVGLTLKIYLEHKSKKDKEKAPK